MTREDAEYVRGKCRVIAVNNQGIDAEIDGVKIPAMAPWADALYAADNKWWKAYAPHSLGFAGHKVTIRDSYGLRGLECLQISQQPVFDPRPTHLVTGGNSGYQAIHLAVHFGAKRIVLLGYDMKSHGLQRHWFGNHPGRLNSLGNYASWIRSFNRFAPVLKKMGVEVLNCTRVTALSCFDRADLRSVL